MKCNRSYSPSRTVRILYSASRTVRVLYRASRTEKIIPCGEHHYIGKSTYENAGLRAAPVKRKLFRKNIREYTIEKRIEQKNKEKKNNKPMTDKTTSINLRFIYHPVAQIPLRIRRINELSLTLKSLPGQ